jgi:hypothetical protein
MTTGCCEAMLDATSKVLLLAVIFVHIDFGATPTSNVFVGVKKMVTGRFFERRCRFE